LCNVGLLDEQDEIFGPDNGHRSVKVVDLCEAGIDDPRAGERTTS
jgi:hypothetical protein